jgi:acetyl-CoA C-acetyltransferase
MLEGAERTAIQANITRQQLDRWVLRSHALAQKARESGILADLLVEVKDGINADEGIRPRMSQKLLDRLPYILPNGQVLTAANACLTNDGAAFVLLCSQRYMQAHHLTAWAEFIDIAEIGADSNTSPRTAILAIHKLLDKHQMSANDISIFECNEAFAVIDELFAREFGESAVDRYNIYGGALAYGHPYGASGGIITLHAIRALQNTNGNYAICSIAAAGGIGSAILLKGVNHHA